MSRGKLIGDDNIFLPHDPAPPQNGFSAIPTRYIMSIVHFWLAETIYRRVQLFFDLIPSCGV